jgi:hypothetical protein
MSYATVKKQNDFNWRSYELDAQLVCMTAAVKQSSPASRLKVQKG